MIKEKRIKIPIYETFVFVGIYDNDKELNEKYNADSKETTGAVCWGSTGGTAVFFKKDKLNTNIIVHECVHIVNYIFKEKGIKLDLDNDEAQAYLTDYIFKEIVKVLKNFNITLTF